MGAPGGFRPPPYPYDRLAELQAVAEATGEPLDLSVGSPCDPLPDVVGKALTASLDTAVGYPASVGFLQLRQAASSWMARRLGVEIPPEQVLACVGSKEFVAGLPRLLALRDPSRDTVLYPSISYPTYAMGAELAGLRAVPVDVDDAWHPDLATVSDDDASRAVLLWLNEPGNPTGSVAGERWFAEVVEWARRRGVIVVSDECYVEFSFDEPRASALSAGSEGVLAVHSLSKRSNMAGLRAGFVAGDAQLIGYAGEVRKHAGLMVPGPVQLAAAGALGDDDHVETQCDRYRARRELVVAALEGTGVRHEGGPGTFYLWLADDRRDAWALAGEFAKAGIVAAPGDLYGESPAVHVRVALVAPLERLEPAVARLRSVLGAG